MTAQTAEHDPADDHLWTEDRTWGSPHSWRTAGLDADWLDATADDPCFFWLGSHRPAWAWHDVDKVGRPRPTGPLFISATELRRRKSPFPRASVPVAIDSGGFTEVTQRGGWTISPADYVALVRRAIEQLGTVAWAAIQDWMCEDVALAATGLTVADHQRLTIESYLELTALAPEVRWLPVLQGRTVGDYLEHIDAYARAGVDLRAHQLVGLGSVCRRQATDEIREIVGELAGRGIRLHGFGVKALGLAAVADLLRSADSLAWSYQGRRMSACEGKLDSTGRNLGNSPEQAEAWRRRMQAIIDKGAIAILDGAGHPAQLMLPLDIEGDQ